MEQQSERKHINGLDGVRGVAALLIITAHILDIIFQGTSLFGLTHQVAALIAYSGMSLFFVLSGVVMEITYGGEYKSRQERVGLYIIYGKENCKAVSIISSPVGLL